MRKPPQPGLERAGKRWNATEKIKLEWLWADNPLHVIAKVLKRTPRAVYAFALTEMGLTPKRSELVSIGEAARRAGIAPKKMGRLLHEARVRLWPTRRAVMVGTPSRPHRRVNMVKWEAALEVVQDHLSKYTIQSAANELNIHPTTMKRIMVWAGHSPPPIRNRAWRVDFKDAKAALDAYTKAYPKQVKHMRTYRQSARTSSRSSSSCSNR